MRETIDKAIEKMASQAKSCQDSQKALHYSQAALNLAHTRQIVEGKKPQVSPKGAGR